MNAERIAAIRREAGSGWIHQAPTVLALCDALEATQTELAIEEEEVLHLIESRGRIEAERDSLQAENTEYARIESQRAREHERLIEERDRLASQVTAAREFYIDLIETDKEKGRIPRDFACEAADLLAGLTPTEEPPKQISTPTSRRLATEAAKRYGIET